MISDGQSYSSADGDAFVFGESEVVYHDGSVGVAADVAFNFEEFVGNAEESKDLEF